MATVTYMRRPFKLEVKTSILISHRAGFPAPLCVAKALKDPLNVDCPSTIFRIQKFVTREGELLFDVERILEDRDAKVLPVSTGVVHDAKNDMFFMGSITSPFITVCERNV